MYDRKTDLLCAMVCFLLAGLLFLGRLQDSREALAGRLAPAMLRFHILANSDSDADQQVKLEVRSLILDYMQEHMKGGGKAETIDFLNTHKSEIEDAAGAWLKKRGFPYSARLEMTRSYFPTRVYDDVVIPCGVYDAARVTLGAGKGHNWWCVLYPRFCFVDAACREVPEESRALLYENLSQDDRLALEDDRPEIDIRFLFFPSLVLTPPSPDR